MKRLVDFFPVTQRIRQCVIPLALQQKPTTAVLNL